MLFVIKLAVKVIIQTKMIANKNLWRQNYHVTCKRWELRSYLKRFSIKNKLLGYLKLYRNYYTYKNLDVNFPLKEMFGITFSLTPSFLSLSRAPYKCSRDNSSISSSHIIMNGSNQLKGKKNYQQKFRKGLKKVIRVENIVNYLAVVKSYRNDTKFAPTS